MHVLDNPVWHSLIGPHATVAERVGFAARYLPDVSIFAAVPDEIPPDTWADLRELIGPGGVEFFTRPVDLPDGWEQQVVAPCRQMVLSRPITLDTSMKPATETLLTLTAADVPEMVALVERTKPGPIVKRTIELGTYLGVRNERNELVAMAGERFHPPGYTEISLVCTDPEHQGRGLASQLVRALVQGIHDRDETPILHMTLTNEGAHRLYSDLGFETRRLIDVIMVTAPT